MKKLILICFVLLALISLISGSCSEGQIDINSATLEELKGIDYVGEDRAEQIINLRPFSSVNDLIRVSGIAEITLDKILDQELACVNGFEEEPEEKVVEEETQNETLKEVTQESIEEYIEDPVGGLGGKAQPITPEVIKLNPLSPKDIKSEEDKKVLDKRDYATYGFIAFCILIGVLLILKNKRKQKRNEIV